MEQMYLLKCILITCTVASFIFLLISGWCKHKLVNRVLPGSKWHTHVGPLNPFDTREYIRIKVLEVKDGWIKYCYCFDGVDSEPNVMKIDSLIARFRKVEES